MFEGDQFAVRVYPQAQFTNRREVLWIWCAGTLASSDFEILNNVRVRRCRLGGFYGVQETGHRERGNREICTAVPSRLLPQYPAPVNLGRGPRNNVSRPERVVRRHDETGPY